MNEIDFARYIHEDGLQGYRTAGTIDNVNESLGCVV